VLGKGGEGMERKKREGREWEVDSERRGDDGKGGTE